MSDGLKQSVDKHVVNMQGAIELFHRANAPVIFTYHSYDARAIVQGTQEFEVLPGIEVKPIDERVVKTYQNAFNKTNLESIIREKNCDAVIIIGLSAMHCVYSTYLGAYDHDLYPYLLRDAVAAPDEESVDLAQKLCDTLSLKAVAQILGKDPKSVMMGNHTKQ
jgi:nicotinamidase-related amidase